MEKAKINTTGRRRAVSHPNEKFLRGLRVMDGKGCETILRVRSNGETIGDGGGCCVVAGGGLDPTGALHPCTNGFGGISLEISLPILLLFRVFAI